MASKATIDDIGVDLLENILSRLPALAFASADCVSLSWHHVCGRILCRPKLSSACFLNDSIQVAVEEVVNKVLSEPIRPQFAIARVFPAFMEEAIQLTTAKLGSKVPVVFNYSDGIIGSDAISHEFIEGSWASIWKGFMLTIGFTPGLKVKSISLLKQPQDPGTFLIDQFITDIREFSTSISGRKSPAAIMIFSEREAGNVVMEKMDYAMSPETVIVGECTWGFSHDDFAAVALVFVKDRNKPLGIGEIKFHAVLSSGLSPVGPTYTVDSVRESPRGMTKLTRLGEGPCETDLRNACIGVTKRRICSVEHEDAKGMTSFVFHDIEEFEDRNEVLFDEVFLSVNGVGIRTGDTYRYYRPGYCVGDVSKLLKQRIRNGSDKLEVYGCFLFSPHMRSLTPDADRFAFLENFPGVTFGGDICSVVIGRGCLVPQESPEQQALRNCLHEFGAVYFIMSFAPP